MKRRRSFKIIFGIACLATLTVALFGQREDALQWDLTEAAGRGDLKEVQRLFKAGAKLDAFPQRAGTEGGCPALLEAVWGEHEDVVRFFVENGAKLEIWCADSGPPLASAIGRRNHKIASLLIEHGACVNDSTRQILEPRRWVKAEDQKMFGLLKSHGAITRAILKKVPPTTFLCIGKQITEPEIAGYLDKNIPALKAAARDVGVPDNGLVHVTYMGRNLKRQSPFLIEIAIPFDNDMHAIPAECHVRTASEFKCLAGETSGPRKNIDSGARILESELWGKAYPTYDMREVYHHWKSSGSNETRVEIQLGLHHPARDANGRRYQQRDHLQYEPTE
jgi:hypothetical protein